MDRLYIEKIVAASLLGDGCVHVPNDGSVNAKYTQNKTADHGDYVDWITERLGTITKVSTLAYQPKMENAKSCIAIQTRCHPFYTQFRNRMYGTGKKCVDRHYLTLLDYEFLAVWFQEDGTTNVRQRERDRYPEVQVSIATNCFSYGDHMLLKLALKEKLSLDWNIRQHRTPKGELQYVLALRRSHADVFFDGIRPFVASSFMYKCPSDVPRNPKLAGEDMIRAVQECTEADRNVLPAVDTV